jgi:hypothetical protein
LKVEFLKIRWERDSAHCHYQTLLKKAFSLDRASQVRLLAGARQFWLGRTYTPKKQHSTAPSITETHTRPRDSLLKSIIIKCLPLFQVCIAVYWNCFILFKKEIDFARLFGVKQKVRSVYGGIFLRIWSNGHQSTHFQGLNRHYMILLYNGNDVCW